MATFPIVPNLIREQKEYKERRECRTMDYKSLYRFESENVKWMSDHFLDEAEETKGGALSKKSQMEVFLRYLADPGFQKGVGEDVGCTQSTISRTVEKVKNKILEKLDFWIRFPTTPEEIVEAKEQWATRFKIPCCIGAIDCTHVPITKPGPDKHGDEYINRKSFASINVQATCNALEWFTSVDASYPGSVHDSRILKNSSINQILQTISRADRTFLVADSGYGLTSWIITPYKNPNTLEQVYFNNIYSKDRVIIERVFGQLKRRFPALHYKIRVKLDRASGLIVAAFILHNIAKYLNDDSDFPELQENQMPAEEIGEDCNAAHIRARGQIVRDEIAAILYNQRNN